MADKIVRNDFERPKGGPTGEMQGQHFVAGLTRPAAQGALRNATCGGPTDVIRGVSLRDEANQSGVRTAQPSCMKHSLGEVPEWPTKSSGTILNARRAAQRAKCRDSIS